MRKPGYYRGAMARLREEWGGHCVDCGSGYGWGTPLEFAHLPGKPTGLSGRGRGQAARYHDVKRNPGSYVLLCAECHEAMDGRGGVKGVWRPERGTMEREVLNEVR